MTTENEGYDEAEALPPKTIAVFEEDDEYQAVAELLTAAGYSVLRYSCADFITVGQAHSAILTSPPDLIILQSSGDHSRVAADFVKLLRMDVRSGTIPVIFATNDSVFLQVKTPMLEQLRAIPLEAPFDPDHLLSIVHTLLNPHKSDGE
jgi:DNA-binding response OmpR family regulator